jgi:hypothetical protein
MRNVSALMCCGMNYCQHFPCEKTLLRQEYWSLSFEDRKAYKLNIPRLHTRRDMKQQKFITMQCSNWETTWYKIVGVSKLTYMLDKSDNK